MPVIVSASKIMIFASQVLDLYCGFAVPGLLPKGCVGGMTCGAILTMNARSADVGGRFAFCG